MSGCGVYTIEHTASGKVYVGSSVNITKRWAMHRRELGRGVHINQKLQRAWDKHGASEFTFSVIEETGRTENLAAEQCWLDKLNAVADGYNISPIAGRPSGRLGRPHTEATKALIRAKRVLQIITPESAAKTRAKNLGMKRSPEFCAAASAMRLGKKLSASHVASIARVRTGTTVSPETRARMSAAAKASRAERKLANDVLHQPRRREAAV